MFNLGDTVVAKFERTFPYVDSNPVKISIGEIGKVVNFTDTFYGENYGHYPLVEFIGKPIIQARGDWIEHL
jgi:hypothetical protein